jgi:hypothetical protein
MANFFNAFGYSPFLNQYVSEEKAHLAAYLLNLGANCLLKPIPVSQFKEEMAKKLDPMLLMQADKPPPPQKGSN